MKQKLGNAIAILPNPDFLILDEPLNGLDPVAIIDFRKLIKRLNEEREMTIIISSHILSELYHVATCFGIIDNGQFIKEISRIDFDQLSQEYIVLQTNQVDLASQVIKEYMHQPIKVVDQNEIHIFGLSSDVKEIAPILVQEGIKIDGIYYAKQDLENYFANLINLDKEKNHD
jgi:ABC-2 type transport system ATP-binding protein